MAQEPDAADDLAAAEPGEPIELIAEIAALLGSLRDTLVGLIVDNAPTNWLIAVVAIAASFAVLLLLRWGLRRAFENPKRLWGRQVTLGRLARQTHTWVLAVFAIYIGLTYLTVPALIDNLSRVAVIVAFFAQLAIWASELVAIALERRAERLRQTNKLSSAMALVQTLARFVIWSIALLLVLNNIGVNVTALVAGLGIGGIAIGLAAQSIVADLFSSLSIVFDRPFEEGDFIILGPDHLGTVERIGLKTTRIRSLSGEQLVCSNSDLLAARIRNYKRMYERRIVFRIGVTYQTPHSKLTEIPGMIRAAIEAEPDTRVDRCHFASYGDFALVFETVYFVLGPDYNLYMDRQQAINLAIHRAFEDAGIDFAYPTQTVYVEPTETAPAASARS